MIALALMAIGQPAPDGAAIDGPPLAWTMDHAPYGADITLDGKVWINTNKVGARDDYAILASDLFKVLNGSATRHRLWIRGYHLRNPAVTHRESKLLVVIDCAEDKATIERQLFYSAGGDVVGEQGPVGGEAIVPGSFAERWRKAACEQSR